MGIFDFVGEIVKPVTGLIDNLSTSDEEKLTLKNKLTEIENTYKSKLLDYEATVAESKKEVMIAELKQDDKYTKRARPTVLYSGLAIMFINNVLLPWISYFLGRSIPQINLPGEFWLAWGGVAGVYAFGRTQEKIKS